MNKISRSFASILVLLILISSLSVLVNNSVYVQSTVTEPANQWQKDYGVAGPNGYDDTNVEYASNVIQTSDGGYAFMSLGWSYQFTFFPSTVFKVDSIGKLQWQKTIELFQASVIIQTDDEGFEISGYWDTYGTTYELTPTLIKLDSNGDIQWSENYSKIPDFGINYTTVQTSDGGFAYNSPFYDRPNTSGTITKTDSNNNTQWVKSLTYTSIDGTGAISLSSVIETSDGALAILGVGYNLFDNPRTGRIYLTKTEPFLPLPSPTQLPTPMPTTTIPELSWFVIVPLLLSLFTVVVIVRHRKSHQVKKSSKPPTSL